MFSVRLSGLTSHPHNNWSCEAEVVELESVLSLHARLEHDGAGLGRVASTDQSLQLALVRKETWKQEKNSK